MITPVMLFSSQDGEEFLFECIMSQGRNHNIYWGGTHPPQIWSKCPPQYIEKKCKCATLRQATMHAVRNYHKKFNSSPPNVDSMATALVCLKVSEGVKRPLVTAIPSCSLSILNKSSY